MHLAAIDIGTNSLHMIVVRTAADGSFEIVDREKEMVRLGAGGLEGRPLAAGTMAAALQTLQRFQRLAESRGVADVVAVATSAVREAPNGGDFLAAITRETGIRARVIAGAEEARLIHLAAVHAIDVGAGSAVVVDIGGGSTEITLGSAAAPRIARSFRLGVIRLGDRYASRDPLSADDERRMTRHVTRELGDYLASLAREGFDRVIGTSGTILALGALASGPAPAADSDTALRHRRVSAKALHRLRRTLARQTLDQRLRLPGLDPRRADLVVPGAVLLDTILQQLGAAEITLCDMSLREGVVLDYLRQRRLDIERVERYPDIRRRSVVELAQRCRYDAPHAGQVSALALSIFDQTAAVHGLEAQAREWLDHAALLHDIGEHIGYERHHRHSYYLITQGGLRGFEPDEVEIIALVARYHRRATPKKGHPGFSRLSRPARRAVRWLAAMLRLAEGLDRSRAQLVDTVSLTPMPDGWTLRLIGRGDVELEYWAAQRHRAALEAALGAAITVADPWVPSAPLAEPAQQGRRRPARAAVPPGGTRG